MDPETPNTHDHHGWGLCFASRLVNPAKKHVNRFHRGSRFGHEGPTFFHNVPQIVRDVVLPIWSRGGLFLIDPLVNNFGFTIEVGEGPGLRDTFEYQQCERIRVGKHRCREIVVFDELGGCIPHVRRG